MIDVMIVLCMHACTTASFEYSAQKPLYLKTMPARNQIAITHLSSFKTVSLSSHPQLIST